MNERIIRKYFRFFGHVQGVGFRYRAEHAAGMLGVAGFVRNKYDGSVEMEAEGTEEAIDRLIEMIEAGRFVRIENVEIRTIPVKNERHFICLDDDY